MSLEDRIRFVKYAKLVDFNIIPNFSVINFYNTIRRILIGILKNIIAKAVQNRCNRIHF